jgi:hypothetical protein
MSRAYELAVGLARMRYRALSARIRPWVSWVPAPRGCRGFGVASLPAAQGSDEL